MEKNLEIKIVLTSDTEFDVEFYEPETGSFDRVTCHDSGILTHQEWQQENNNLAAEIRFWVENMREDE